MKRIPVLLSALLVVFACEKEISLKSLIHNKTVEKAVIAAAGAILNTSDSIKLIIPSNALLSDGVVFVGRTGDEPASVPNKDLQIFGIPFTIKIPSDSIIKPIQVSFPVNSNAIPPDNFFIFLYNGSTYFPVEYSLNEGIVNVTIDIINWEPGGMKNTALVSEIIIITLVVKQTPQLKEMGLNKVTIDQNGTMSYHDPSASPSSKILLLVHGWTGRPTVWDSLLCRIKTETNPTFSEYWTFGYNSSWSIEDNAELLDQYLQEYSNGATIDIVAHSMGGLVSRSMIEQYNGAQYIDKLIMLGTPHQGSPLAVMRDYLGTLVASDDLSDYNLYNYFTQGFEDLNTTSEYINQMMKLTQPAIPYYVIAATCRTDWNKKIEGPDDGIVGVSSALGVPGAVKPDAPFDMPYDEAHRKMTRYEPIYDQVLEYLKER
jgi:pimeloyl-ACP methyl ester carboxylesterase